MLERIIEMKRLFLVGNGFDCHLHGLPTKYIDFRNYIVSRYPNAGKATNYIPEPFFLQKGETEYDQAEVAQYIVTIIDSCEKGDWSDLETHLGNAIFEELSEELFLTDFESDDEKEFCHNFYNNEDISSHILDVFVSLEDLFADLVNESLSMLSYESVAREHIKQLIFDDSVFLTFNYTRTLEEAYKIEDDKRELGFGHGDDSDFLENGYRMGQNLIIQS